MEKIAGRYPIRVRLDARVCNRARLARDPRFDGRFFIAVLSTGIYCRPICPSPTAKQANIRFFRSAAEAVAAGFRPCLRCRPETLPGTPAWSGTSATVSRALRLITDGLLTQSVARLSSRLGISERHLHRLFLSHLGASPTAVMKTWRLNFAKELISDTDLPMSLVAQASGFGSVRRFNDSIRRLYGKTPTALRRARPPALRSRGNAYVFHLSYRLPFDWEWLLEFLGARAIPGVEEVVSGAYRRSFEHQGLHGVLEVRHEKPARSLEVRVQFSPPFPLLPVVTRLRGMFDLATDVSVIAEHLERDPFLAPLVRRFGPPRVPGAWDVFELAVQAILAQQGTATAAASRLAGWIAEQFGQRLSCSDAGSLRVVFPSPRVLVNAPLQSIPDARARAIRLLARAVASGSLPFDGTGEEAAKTLACLPGIGDWAAQYIAMRALREPDAFPASDAVLRREAGGGRPLTTAVMSERAERWRPWRAYAAIYLWRSAAEESQSEASRGIASKPRLSLAEIAHTR